jgi:hypothetical protein
VIRVNALESIEAGDLEAGSGEERWQLTHDISIESPRFLH